MEEMRLTEWMLVSILYSGSEKYFNRYFNFSMVYFLGNYTWRDNVTEGLQAIQEQIIKLCSPQQILLFGL